MHAGAFLVFFFLQFVCSLLFVYVCCLHVGARSDSFWLFTILALCVSSLRRGHANLLCIVPVLTDDPRRESRSDSFLFICVIVIVIVIIMFSVSVSIMMIIISSIISIVISMCIIKYHYYVYFC